MEVSKLMLCSNIDENTPLFILIDIADSMSIDYTKILSKSGRSGEVKILGVNTLIEKILSGPKYLIKIPYTRDMYTYMALMVNSEVDWTPEDLTTAYTHSMSFLDKSKYLDLAEDFKYGYQDSQNISNIQPIIVYGMCRYYQIETKLTMTQDELKTSYINFIKDKVELKKKIIEGIDDNNLLDLYHLIQQLKK